MQTATCALGSSRPGARQGLWPRQHLWLQRWPWWGSSPLTAVEQEPRTSQPAVRLSKQGLPGLREACSWLATWKDCHPSCLTRGVRSTGPRARPECCGSQLQMSLRSLSHRVHSFSLSLSAWKESRVFLAFLPGFTAIYSYRVFYPA